MKVCFRFNTSFLAIFLFNLMKKRKVKIRGKERYLRILVHSTYCHHCHFPLIISWWLVMHFKTSQLYVFTLIYTFFYVPWHIYGIDFAPKNYMKVKEYHDKTDSHIYVDRNFHPMTSPKKKKISTPCRFFNCSALVLIARPFHASD